MSVYTWFYDGVMGSGKTLGMSIRANYYKEISHVPVTIYSNYGLKGSKPFTSFEDFIDVCKQQTSIICLDESHIDISSRDFNANSVKFFTTIVFYLRKMRCTLMMTSPLFENVDSRVRGVTNLYTAVSKDKDYFLYETYDVQSMKFLEVKKIRQDKAKLYAQKIFDTNSMVTPLEYPKNREEFNDLLNRLKLANNEFLLREGVPNASSVQNEHTQVENQLVVV